MTLKFDVPRNPFKTRQLGRRKLDFPEGLLVTEFEFFETNRIF